MTFTILLVVMQAFGGILIALPYALPRPGRKGVVIFVIFLGGFLIILGAGLREYEANRTSDRLSRVAEVSRERAEALWLVILDECSSCIREPSTEEPSATLGPTSDQLRILAPHDGDKVQWRQAVTGVIAGRANDLWVVVHPLETAEYWVQPKINVRAGGNWRVRAYIGRPGDIDVGKDFEVMAVAGSKQRLAEGRVLGDWPEARWRSEVVAVMRR